MEGENFDSVFLHQENLRFDFRPILKISVFRENPWTINYKSSDKSRLKIGKEMGGRRKFRLGLSSSSESPLRLSPNFKNFGENP